MRVWAVSELGIVEEDKSYNWDSDQVFSIFLNSKFRHEKAVATRMRLYGKSQNLSGRSRSLELRKQLPFPKRLNPYPGLGA
jgi:hypothetical protein